MQEAVVGAARGARADVRASFLARDGARGASGIRGWRRRGGEARGVRGDGDGGAGGSGASGGDGDGGAGGSGASGGDGDGGAGGSGASGGDGDGGAGGSGDGGAGGSGASTAGHGGAGQGGVEGSRGDGAGLGVGERPRGPKGLAAPTARRGGADSPTRATEARRRPPRNARGEIPRRHHPAGRPPWTNRRRGRPRRARRRRPTKHRSPTRRSPAPEGAPPARTGRGDACSRVGSLAPELIRHRFGRFQRFFPAVIPRPISYLSVTCEPLKFGTGTHRQPQGPNRQCIFSMPRSLHGWCA